MADDKILTLHPQGKKGVNISRAKYEIVKAVILECLLAKTLTHLELTECVSTKLKKGFEGSVPWYTESVKLDLEARKIIERVEQRGKVIYRLKKV
ncbi:MAG: hypothetical protein FJY85_07205 [Deltaproteobacteria bacterium]|nr:hypothetical protein [Deltaproteobacteria bacterium]